MSAPQKITITFSRRLALVLVLVGTVSTGAVVGLVYAPGSPGLPFVSPTYQAQKAPFQYQGISLDAAVYDVWYVPDTTTLILAVMAAFPKHTLLRSGSGRPRLSNRILPDELATGKLLDTSLHQQ